jgi:hypothetical protein
MQHLYGKKTHKTNKVMILCTRLGALVMMSDMRLFEVGLNIYSNYENKLYENYFFI